MIIRIGNQIWERKEEKKSVVREIENTGNRLKKDEVAVVGGHMLIGTKKRYVCLSTAAEALRIIFFDDEISDIMADWNDLGMSEIVGF